ncbi:MAG: glycosyltransferase family 2 protein [Thermoplasmata archaeon]|nr:glycosyltransferase family 2 protein [Thermoplasmata archaeon]
MALSPAGDLAPSTSDRTDAKARSSTARGPPLILLPTLNEEAGLRATLEELGRVEGFPDPTPPAVLVVDGHSTDGTARVAAQFHCRLLPQRGRGKGAAVRDGLEWAVANGFGSIAVLDADGTYPCDQLPAMLRLLERQADIVAGVRRPTQSSGSTARNLVHRVGNGALNTWAALLSRGPILDVCTGFWGVRSAIVPSLGLESTGFEVESELFVKAMRQRLRFAQIPVEYRSRIGEAKLHAVRDGARIFLSIARHSVRPGLPDSAPAFRSDPPAPTASAREPYLARALPTVLASFPASSVLIIATPARFPEAIDVGRSVGACRPTVPVAVRLSSIETEPSAASWGHSARHASVAEDSVVVTLPDPGPNGSGPRAAFVHVPSVPRTLRVEGGEDPEGPVGATGARLAGREPAVERLKAPGALRILSATLDPSGVQKQRVLLASNSARARLRVSEVVPRAPPGERPSDDSPFPSIPILPGVTRRR